MQKANSQEQYEVVGSGRKNPGFPALQLVLVLQAIHLFLVHLVNQDPQVVQMCQQVQAFRLHQVLQQYRVAQLVPVALVALGVHELH